jgi:hypothetical protein
MRANAAGLDAPWQYPDIVHDGVTLRLDPHSYDSRSPAAFRTMDNRDYTGVTIFYKSIDEDPPRNGVLWDIRFEAYGGDETDVYVSRLRADIPEAVALLRETWELLSQIYPGLPPLPAGLVPSVTEPVTRASLDPRFTSFQNAIIPLQPGNTARQIGVLLGSTEKPYAPSTIANEITEIRKIDRSVLRDKRARRKSE